MTAREQIFTAIVEYLHAQAGVDPSRIHEDTLLVEDLGLDSLDLLGATQILQNRYGISLDNERLAAVRTMGDLLTFVQTCAASRTPSPRR